MGIIWLLKMLADISAFYLFAAPVAAYFGGRQLLTIALIQGVSYALARSLGKKWLQPLPLVLLAGCYWLCWGNLFDLLAITPATGYLLWQFVRKSGVPEYDQQQGVLEGLWKLLALAALASVLIGTLPTLIPFGLLAFFANAALLRTLRHDPQVYLQPRFQLTNLGILAAVPLVSLFVGTGPVAKGITAAFKWIYADVFLPVFQFLLQGPLLLIEKFFNYLGTFFTLEKEPEETTEPLGKLDGSPAYPSIDAQQMAETQQVLQFLLIALLVIIALVGMFLLMRKLGRKGDAIPAAKETEIQRVSLATAGKRHISEDSPTVQAVRKHYKRYLKLCIKSGVRIPESSTSSDICRNALERKQLQPQAKRIRQIYIRARYAGLATKEDVKEISALYAESKQAK